MEGGMSTRDDQKAIGRLEKGVEVLEQAVNKLDRSHSEHTLQVISLLNDLRGDFKREIENIHIKIEEKNGNLEKKFDGAIKGQNDIRRNVQKLATTVSVIVAVGAVILKGAFDLAKDAFAATFISH